MEQFRIAGRALVVPAPKHTLDLITRARLVSWFEPGIKALRDQGLEEGDGGVFEFERKRQEVYDAMPSVLKAEWARPIAPGAIVDSLDVLDGWACDIPQRKDIKTEEDRTRWEAGLENFAMVLIEPMRVDWLQLGVLPNRRTIFTRTDDPGQGWTETFVAS